MIWCVQSKIEVDKLQSKIDRFLCSYHLRFNLSRKGRKLKLDMGEIYQKLDILTVWERRKFMLLKFYYKFRNNKMFKHWFMLSQRATKERPKLIAFDYKSNHVKSLLRCNVIAEWNAMLSNRNVMIIDDDDFSIVHVIKEYLLHLRSKIFLYF